MGNEMHGIASLGDSENEQHVIAVEFYVWADTAEQAREKLEWALKRLEYDSALQDA